MTPPVPQSLALVGNSLTPEDRAALERITIAPCLCGMFKIEGETTLPTPGALQHPDGEITWIADNQRKGISPNARIITVHAGPAYSQLIYDWPEADVLDRMQEELEQWLAQNWNNGWPRRHGLCIGSTSAGATPCQRFDILNARW